MTDAPRHLQSHDERGNLIGSVALADGTIESVDALNAWAEAFEAAEDSQPLTPPRRGRPSLTNDPGESPRVTVRLPRALLVETDAAAKTLGSNRADLVRVALEQYLSAHAAAAALEPIQRNTDLAAIRRRSDPTTDLRGADVAGRGGVELGKVDEIYLDNETLKPEWAAVRTGLFGGNVSLVPLSESTFDGSSLTVPFSKDKIQGAPHHDPGREITADDEDELYAYYGVGGTSHDDTTTTTGRTTGTAADERPSPPSTI